jgi:alkane 1-monooxygenase
MKRISALKYLSVLSLPVLAYVSFTHTGWPTFAPLLEAFVLVPVLELFFRADARNLDEAEEAVRKDDRLFDVMVYLVVPVQLFMLWFFLESMQQPGLTVLDKVGRISGMGLLCGVMGINVAHELGHRSKGYEQWMAKALLMTSLYMHFYIEHNRGHHRHVSTPEDPSSARKGEMLYTFWLRSVVYSYVSAWRIERERLAKNGRAFLSLHNEMLWFQVVQAGLLAAIGWYYGLAILLYFVAAAVMGFLLLETVNYIEHYGLSREKKGDHYERVMPHHSWNSNHVVGRIMLFELSRHSDHHYIASRKYQILRHIDESPQMPTGYPGMMLMATVPPLWFKVMDRRLG